MLDITTIIIVLAMAVAFCIPFFLSHQKKKKHEQSLLNIFHTKAADHQLEIGAYDIWRRSYAIGIDSRKSQLLYIKFSPEIQETIIDLKATKRVSIHKEEKEIGTGKDKEKITEKLALSFTSTGSLNSKDLEFYDSEETMGLMGEPVLIQKWHNLVKDSLGQDRHKPQVVETL